MFSVFVLFYCFVWDLNRCLLLRNLFALEEEAIIVNVRYFLCSFFARLFLRFYSRIIFDFSSDFFTHFLIFE